MVQMGQCQYLIQSVNRPVHKWVRFGIFNSKLVRKWVKFDNETCSAGLPKSVLS